MEQSLPQPVAYTSAAGLNNRMDKFLNFHPVVDGQVLLCGGAREGDQFSRHLWLVQPSHLQVCSLSIAQLDSRDELTGAEALFHEAGSQLPSTCRSQWEDLCNGWSSP